MGREQITFDYIFILFIDLDLALQARVQILIRVVRAPADGDLPDLPHDGLCVGVVAAIGGARGGPAVADAERQERQRGESRHWESETSTQRNDSTKIPHPPTSLCLLTGPFLKNYGPTTKWSVDKLAIQWGFWRDNSKSYGPITKWS